MIIPLNKEVALDMAATPVGFQVIWKELGRLVNLHCQDNIICFSANDKEMVLDLPYRSKDNGVPILMDLMNTAWTYDKNNPKEKILDYMHNDSGVYLLLRYGAGTTNLHPANWPKRKEEMQ